MIKFAENNDISQLKKIWEIVFEDDRELIDCFFEKLFKKENTLVFKENSAVAMLYMIPYNNGRDYYLYALATLQEYRNKGIMSELIRYALKVMKERGVESVFLIPDSENLKGYYSKFGFDTELEIMEYTLPESVEYRLVTADKYLEKVPLLNRKTAEYVIYEELMESDSYVAEIILKGDYGGSAVMNKNTIRHYENLNISGYKENVWKTALICSDFCKKTLEKKLYIPF